MAKAKKKQADTAAADEEQVEIPSLNAELGAQLRAELGDERLLELYEKMVLIRRFEEQAGRAYQMGKIKGFCHLYIGQEAVATGAMAAIDERDYVVAAYREHGQALARGLETNAVMAELFGKAAGVSAGKGGSMHLFDVDKHFYGGWGIVGGQIPTATGIGFAISYRDEQAVCLCFFGEGSIHQGAFHEALNMASTWDLPVVYIIEDNRYAMGTALERVSAITDLSKKAVGYDVDALTIDDGQDIFEVYAGLKQAVDRARDDRRPSLVHVHTYRYRGHSMSDPATYRTKEEVEREQRKDPIQRFTRWLVDQGVRDEDALQEVDARCKQQAKDAIKFADQADFPEADELFSDVYVDWPGQSY